MVTSSVMASDAGARAGVKVNLPRGATKEIAEQRARHHRRHHHRRQDGGRRQGGQRRYAAKTSRRRKAKDAETQVIVQADEATHHGRVVAVMELAKAAGLRRLAIATRRAGSHARVAGRLGSCAGAVWPAPPSSPSGRTCRTCARTDSPSPTRPTSTPGHAGGQRAHGGDERHAPRGARRGLKPGTRVRYRLLVDARSARPARSRPPPGRPLTFVVYGDTRDGAEVEREIRARSSPRARPRAPHRRPGAARR